MTTDGIEISALSTRCTDCCWHAVVQLNRSQLSVHQQTEAVSAVVIIASRLFIDVEPSVSGMSLV